MAGAASSSSYSSSLENYDVFLSFRGEDTRRNLVSHLYTALRHKQIRTYKDNIILEKGDEEGPALVRTVKNSYICIVIFSKNYASSTWCLRELTEILVRKQEEEIIPVFYEINPSHVRKQTGSFKKAFEKHEKNSELDKETVSKWKASLEKAANFSAWDSQSKNFSDDSNFIEKIVEKVLQKLSCKYPPNELLGLIGIEENIRSIESLLQKVQTIGIWGMGGIGKTTLARAVFDKFSPHYDGRCFLAYVREESRTHGLDDLRKKLLSKLLDGKDIPEEETPFAESRLKLKKVFIVLDDVDDSEQLEKLIGDYDCLGSGSRLIVTTRDKQVLISRGVQEIYEVHMLQSRESIELFSMNAFKHSHPKIGFEELTRKAVDYAGGIPLALKVLGSSLCSKRREVWESALNKLESGPKMKIQHVLRWSYNGLEYEEKMIFLDIACFFKGELKSSVISKVDARGLSAAAGIETLLDRALITINFDGEIEMHKLIQEMGKAIVREEGGKQLWDSQEFREVLKNHRKRLARLEFAFSQHSAELHQDRHHMSCASSTAPHHRKKYDVFLNFRGEDTRTRFISHLYAALCRTEEIRTYKDERIDKGEEVWPSLVEAINDSFLCIVVFSKDYAASTWCLRELTHILESKEKRLVVPVFYEIDPSDIRNQTGTYEEAFKKHDTNFRLDEGTVKNWRAALKKAANLSGWDSQSPENREEAEFIVKIVEDVKQKLDSRFNKLDKRIQDSAECQTGASKFQNSVDQMKLDLDLEQTLGVKPTKEIDRGNKLDKTIQDCRVLLADGSESVHSINEMRLGLAHKSKRCENDSEGEKQQLPLRKKFKQALEMRLELAKNSNTCSYNEGIEVGGSHYENKNDNEQLITDNVREDVFLCQNLNGHFSWMKATMTAHLGKGGAAANEGRRRVRAREEQQRTKEEEEQDRKATSDKTTTKVFFGQSMAASNMSASGEASSEFGIRCRTKRCYYGRKAAVKISEAVTNPNKLFFSCAEGSCKSFEWCKPLDVGNTGESSWRNDEVRCQNFLMQELMREMKETKSQCTGLNEKLIKIENNIGALKLVTVAAVTCCIMFIVKFFVVILVK